LTNDIALATLGRMNMFKPVKAKTVEEYIQLLPKDRKESIEFLYAFIQKNAPSLTPHFAYNMIGFGSFPYKNYKKEIISWPTISLASQKNYISIYICAVENGEYVAEKYKQTLGKTSVGKSLNLEGLKRVIQKAEKLPGLTGANTKNQ
jgi:hypothetical protein